MPIYTRTGDKGQTSLFDGTRVLKSHIRVEAYGTVDELNSVIGAAVAHFKRGQSSLVKRELLRIQHELLDIGSTLAKSTSISMIGLEARTKDFETMIDELTNVMPELKQFILPGGSQAGSLLHVARTVSRRAERKIVALMQRETIDGRIVKYINRLSDLLFTMARYVNYDEKKKEIKWLKK
jgi:cob(I)alamin adenosyltransferase